MPLLRLYKKAVYSLLVLASVQAYAQIGADPLYINYSYVPKSEFRDVPGESSLRFLEANAITPTIELGKTKINNALNYKLMDYGFESASPGVYLPNTLHDFRYTLIVRHKFNDTWGLLAVPKINIRGDFDTFGARNVFGGAAILATNESARHPNFQYAFGVTYNNDFRKNSVLPAAVVNYKTDKWRVNLILPSNGSIAYLHSPKFEYGMYFSLEAGIYALEEYTIYNSHIEYLRTFNAVAAPALAYNIYDKFWLNGRIGVDFARSYHLLEHDYDVHDDRLENNLKPALTMGIGISYRP